MEDLEENQGSPSPSDSNFDSNSDSDSVSDADSGLDLDLDVDFFGEDEDEAPPLVAQPLHHQEPQQQQQHNVNGPDDYVGPTTTLFTSLLLDQPLYPGSPQTLKSFLVTAVNWASKNKLSMTALEEYLRNTADLLPEDNDVPTTLYRLLSTLGIHLGSLEKHACVNDCVLFEDLDKGDYAGRVAEVCDKCQEPRFERRGRSISPRKKFFYIPLSAQVETLKQQPGFDTSAEKMANQIRAGVTCCDSFWGGTMGTSFLQQHPQALDHFATKLALSVGLDGVQTFKKEEYEVWPIEVKFWNLHPEERTSKGFVLMTTLIPGPNNPKNFEPYLKPLLDEILASQTGTFLSSGGREYC